MAFQPAQPVHYSKPDVSDADLSLFAAPIVKSPPKPVQATSPAPTESRQQSGWAPTASPQANDGWDNDDFGISWEQRKCLFPCLPFLSIYHMF